MQQLDTHAYSAKTHIDGAEIRAVHWQSDHDKGIYTCLIIETGRARIHLSASPIKLEELANMLIRQAHSARNQQTALLQMPA
jgi:hypothetical protein